VTAASDGGEVRRQFGSGAQLALVGGGAVTEMIRVLKKSGFAGVSCGRAATGLSIV
jgi:hypothetical protein